MQNNIKTEFQKWFEKHKEECKHIPTFAGKKAKNNLFIIYALATKGALSCWDLALEYLKQTLPNFNMLDSHTIYHKRQSTNSTFYRSLLTLQNKRYVKKEDSLFELTLKGAFFAFMLDPGLVHKFMQRFKDEEIQELLAEGDDLLPPLYPPKNDLEKLRSALSNKIAQETIKNVWKNVFYAWKINLDEIDENELKAILQAKIGKIFSNGKKPTLDEFLSPPVK